MDIKSLNKLAKACRKLGISHLKTDEVEISLSPEIVAAPTKPRKSMTPVNEALFSESDSMDQQKRAFKEMSDHDLLFWSSEGSQ